MSAEVAEPTAPPKPPVATAPVAAGLLTALIAAGALVAYKSSAALATLAKVSASGTLAPKTGMLDPGSAPSWASSLVATANYFGWVWIALSFGLVIGAAVKALVPRRWLARTVARPGVLGALAGVAIGAPLMLCSCCAAPVFEGVYGRSRRLGPSLALMLASPALNPAAIGLTFMLFPGRLAWLRLGAALVLGVGATTVLGRAFQNEGEPAACAVDGAATWAGVGRDFLAALREGFLKTLPAIALGVLASAALAGLVPLSSLAGSGGAGMVLLAAALAVPLAMPTFGEIAIGLALLGAGAPEGVVLAILIAGPAINLPSLLTVGRSVSPRAALATAATVFALAALAGLLA